MQLQFVSLRAITFGSLLILSGGSSSLMAAEAVPFAPHRAVYDMNLADSEKNNAIEALTGRLVYEETGNSCDGYSLKARQVISFETAAGASTLDSVSNNYESGDGKHIRFRIESRVNGRTTENTDGEGIVGDDGDFQVRLKNPLLKHLSWKGQVLLPSTHTQKILDAARAGQNTLSARVYDGGNSGETVYETLTIIGSRIAPGTGSNLEEAAQNPVLQGLSRWPVKITYFKAGDLETTPDYSVSSELYENGINRAVKLDFSDFSIRADLKTLELLPKGDCQR